MAEMIKSRSEKVVVGSVAPDFTLPDQAGRSISLGALRGKPVVLYFYPKDNSGGCTAQACAFRDSYEVFKEFGAEVIGVSDDTAASHEGFASRHNLPFILLSDERGAVRARYGVQRTLGIIPGRSTYVIDKAGIVRHIFNSQIMVTKHVDEALNVLKSLS